MATHYQRQGQNQSRAAATAGSSGRYNHTTSHSQIDFPSGSRPLRAQTPLTSVPLRDDFDAITTTHRWSRYTRPTTADPTSEGFLAQLEAVTATRASTVIPRHHRRRNTMPTLSEISLDISQNRHAQGLRRTRGRDRIKSGQVQPTLEETGLDYEMVENNIIEEGPERTVSISKWREQVIRETDDDDAMSVYYVDVEGMVQKDRGYSTRRTRSDENRPRQGETTPDHSRSRPRTRTESTPRESGTLIQPDPFALPSPTAPFRVRAKQPPDTGNHSSISSIQLAPPKAKDSLSPSPVAPASPALPSLETVLRTCQPSLLHILPVLQAVGITTSENLRALALLTEEMRNREVRVEVLRMGVSLLEWAVLLDRVQRGL
ncbi:hypothetical protein MIND_00404400 [Mycena indigotica]|uniref:Uncharacterized protein n=1 Tax=Mycena indigotica TaxID=2126181 RepID=A0A8H6T264_9AGAR|nr:uncharacterized protein MIND_00404400 [Mycena indigotica]KAF7310303.1 hypothetical protein MIND_00404400 [Mycena indigotica]